MNVFRNLIIGIGLVIAMSSSVFAANATNATEAPFSRDVKGAEVCAALMQLNADSDTTFSGKVGAFICEQDIIFGALIDPGSRASEIPFIKSALANLGYTKELPTLGGINPIVVLFTMLLYVSPFVVIALIANVLFSFTVAFVAGNRNHTPMLVENGKTFVAWAAIFAFGFTILFYGISQAVAHTNAFHLNASIEYANYAKDGTKIKSKQMAYANTNAEMLFHIELENEITKSALMYKNSYPLAESTAKRPLGAVRGKDTVLDIMYKKSGFELVGNTDNTYEFELSYDVFLGFVPVQLYKYFTSANYLYGLTYTKLKAGTFDMSTKVGNPSTIGTITIKNTPSATIIDPETSDEVSMKFNNIMVAAGDAGAVSGEELLQDVMSIRDKILPSIKDGKVDYVYADYSALKDKIKQKSLAAYNSQLGAIKDFSKQSTVRVELGSRVYGNIAASQIGFHKNRAFDSVRTTLVQDFITGVRQVNCSRYYDAESINKQYTDKLNAYSGRWAGAEDIWSKMTWRCVKNDNGNLIHYGFNPDTESAKIQEAYALGKASLEAYKIYWGIVIAANQEAMNETLAETTNPMIDAIKFAIHGFASAGAVPNKVNIAQKNIQKMTNALTDIVSVSYHRAGVENNTYINEIAVFGEPNDGEYSNESQVAIDQMNKTYGALLVAPFFKSTAIMTNGSINQFKQSAKSSTMDWIAEKVYAYLQENIMGDVGRALKYSAQLNPDLTIEQGIQECLENPSVCNARPETSLYGATVMLGREALDTGATCLAASFGVEAAYAVASGLGEAGNNVASIGGKSAQGILGIVGGAGKGALAAANATVQAVKPACYALAAAGLGGGYVMPSMLSIAPLAIGISVLLGIISMFFYIMIGSFLDATVNKGKFIEGKRVVLKGMFLCISIVLYGLGLLVMIGLLTSIPAAPIIRFVIGSGMSTSSTIFALALFVVLAVSALIILFRLCQNVPNRIVEMVNRHFSQNDGGLSQAEIANTVQQQVAAVGVAGILYGSANAIQRESTEKLRMLSNKLNKELKQRDLQEVKDQVMNGTTQQVEANIEKTSSVIDDLIKENQKPSGNNEAKPDKDDKK